MELKPKDEHILTALLSCGSIAEAEKISGVSRTTIYNRLADETFKAEYDRRRSLVLNEACNSLQATLTKAVDTIRGIMEDTDTAPQVRLNASALILQNCLKYTEQADIISRIEELEKILKNAEVIDEDEVADDKISVGCRVKVLDVEFDDEMEFSIVGSTEANSLKGFISNESPLGVALIGKKKDAIVEVESPAGMIQYKIIDIQRSL